MDFMSSVKGAFNDAKAAAGKLMPPKQEDADALNAQFKQEGLGKAKVYLEKFKEAETGPEMERLAISGCKNKEEFDKAYALASAAAGERWVNKEPAGQAPAIGRQKLEEYRGSRQAPPAPNKVTVSVDTAELAQKGKTAAKDAGNFIGGKIEKLGKFLQSSSEEAPAAKKPGGPG